MFSFLLSSIMRIFINIWIKQHYNNNIKHHKSPVGHVMPLHFSRTKDLCRQTGQVVLQGYLENILIEN